MNSEQVTIEDMYRAYFDCRKHKRNTLNALQFEVDYERNLRTLCDEINARTYEIGKSICFVVTRPKRREVFAADFRDRVVHHLVIRNLEPLFEDVFIEDNYNCRKGKGTLYGVNRLKEKVKALSNNYATPLYVGKFDLKGFFMSIDRSILLNMLNPFVTERYNALDKDTMLWLVQKIVSHCPEKNCRRKSPIGAWVKLPANKSLFTCGHNKGVPIGNLPSQIFANFYLHWFDAVAVSLFGDGYGRYVDDFYVLDQSKEKILSFITPAKEGLAEIGLTLHPDKVYVQNASRGVNFTGACVRYGRSYISKRTVYNFKKVIEDANSVADMASYAETLTQRINSYLGFFRQHNTYNLRKKILDGLDKSWYDYIYIIEPKVNVSLRTKNKPIKDMIRQFGRTADYQPVRQLTETRYDINFDLVYYKDEEGKEEKSLGTWSKHSYFSRPTTEQMQGDVIKYTIQRYENEGLEPPRPEDIDVSKYVID